MERTLCAIAIVALVMCLAMTLALAFIGYQYQKLIENGNGNKPSAHKLVKDVEDNENNLQELPRKEKVCLTPGCVKAAAELLKNMDETVDPCKDFYHFACGGWVESQVIPDDRTSVSVFSVLQDELNNKLRGLVEKEPENIEPSHITSMRNMYKTCMNLTEIEEVGNKPLLDLLQKFGGWPVLEGSNWNESNFDWLNALIHFRQNGFSHDLLLDLSVTPDFRNNTRHVIDLDQASLGMPDRTYLLRGLNDSAVRGYFKLMVESAVILGADREVAEREMLDALQFETILANYSLPREERRNISLLYNKMNISEIQKLAPNIDWHKYFNNLLNEPIPDNEDIIVNVPSFVRKINNLIPETKKRVLANYMIWRVVLQSFATLGKLWRELAQEYNKVITGQDREEPRWEQCMSSLTGSLGIALSSLYVKHHFKGESKDMALDMVNYIHREFLRMLDELDWMDKQTVDYARAKAKAISSYIGYPEQILDDEKVGKLYETLNLTMESYFDNVQRLRKWSTDYAFSQLRKPNLKGDWRKHARAAVVNAYYNALENSIEFPAGILQGSFFDKDRPNYLNFGAIGFVIGHEITHGFDDRGRQFDKDGNNRNWWDHKTDLKFRQRTQCIIEQYSNYTVPENGLRVNGINTQGENIADNGGLKEAFRAYRKWVEDHHEEAMLPGLKYSPDQLFWVSAANVWCGKHRSEVLRLRVLVGSHSPSQFRVIGPLSNLPEFSTSFNCPKASPMNPELKCSVW
ncbi:membrane metallo-endopeptidase-like 1 [Dinothrombium tinctorium]|uniref:Membrane metallo-endopeptidase-like 1 n=1 Tax=Dinothrombium tinctorium TaxID=1965070 RepID=A0A443R4P8_9ACAR|nr:membrane metallo-endopeptidase-like 1 [Dinothrombium tinctorium]